MFMLFFPAALQIYFLTTGLFALAQTYLNNAIVRSMFGIEKRPVLQSTRPIIRTVNTSAVPEQREDEKQLSALDRTVQSLKKAGSDFKKDASDQFKMFQEDQAKKTAGGAPERQPRLPKADLTHAQKYETRRKLEDDREMEEKNRSLREIFEKKRREGERKRRQTKRR